MGSTSSHSRVSRRDLVKGAAGGIGGAILTGPAAAPGEAKEIKFDKQAPSYYRFALGEAQVNVLSDGPLPLDDPRESFLGVPKEEVVKMLEKSFLPIDDVVLEQNAQSSTSATNWCFSTRVWGRSSSSVLPPVV